MNAVHSRRLKATVSSVPTSLGLHGLWSTPLTDRRYRFKDGTAALGAAVPLTGTGNTKTAALATAALAGGTHSLTAVYSGDAYNAGSTTATAVTQTVNKRSSSVALASSANPANFGTSVTLTATVTGFSPSGTMTFKDGSTTLGTGSVLNGAASFNTLGLAAGAHSVTAVYSGDASNLTSRNLPTWARPARPSSPMPTTPPMTRPR
jgi:hypothetical protein